MPLKSEPPESWFGKVEISRIIRSKRRTLALIVEDDGSLIVRAPNRVPRKMIDEFVDRHVEWVIKKQAEVHAVSRADPRQYAPGEVYSYLGENYPLEIVMQQSRALLLDHSFKLSGAAQSRAKQVFRDWYRRQASEVLTERVNQFAESYGFQYAGIRITSARTRWGSCSARGALSFTWRLILAPLDVVDYVVVHELVHTVIHNHSEHFWKNVEQIMPEYRDRRNWLKQHGPKLMR
jgi:predicted metal-dependent hydrolase